MARIIASLFLLLLVPALANAQCVPANSPRQSPGCWPQASSAADSDYVLGWQPGQFPASAVRISISSLINTAPTRLQFPANDGSNHLLFLESGSQNQLQTLASNYASTTQQIDMTNNNNNIKHGLDCFASTINSGTTMNTDCIRLYGYMPHDNGGDVSLMYGLQVGGGNGLSIYNLCGSTPAGLTPDCANGRGIEVAVDGKKYGISVDQKNAGPSTGGAALWALWNDDSTAGILLQPHDDNSPTTRAIKLTNSSNSTELFYVDSAGNGLFQGTLFVNGTTTLNSLVTNATVSFHDNFNLFQAANGTDQKYWDVVNSSTAPELDFRAVDDGFSNSHVWMAAIRGTGYTVSKAEVRTQLILGGDASGVDQAVLSWFRTSNAADQKYWDVFEDTTSLQFRAVNDDYSNSHAYMQVNRGSGYTVSNVQFPEPVQLASFTVAALPTCNAGADGEVAYVTDASSPTWNGTLSGGGSTRTLAACENGTWTAH